MEDKIYIVGSHAIACKSGVKGAGDKVTQKDVGQNFNHLLEIGWIVEKPENKNIVVTEVLPVKEEIDIRPIQENIEETKTEEKPKRQRKTQAPFSGAVKSE